MDIRRILLPLLLLPTLTGCVEGELHTELLPDGAARITVDVAVDTRTLPGWVDNPLDSFTSRSRLRGFAPPGVVAWSEPVRSSDGPWERLVATAYVEDVDDFRIYQEREGRTSEALGFRRRSGPEGGELAIRAGFLDQLEAPLPLPSLDSMGMQITLSERLRAQVVAMLAPMIEGMRLAVRVTVPGELTRADGFSSMTGRTASLEADAPLLVRAMQTRAGVLLDGEALAGPDPRLEWNGGRPDPERRAAFDEELRAAREWWLGGDAQKR